MAGLTLYVDHMSQPSRAILIFCRLNEIDVKIQLVQLHKKEHKSPHFKSINPLEKVPCIEDDGYKLQESHAILRYLVATRPCSDFWYPSDTSRRARVDSVLDWHHSNLRRGSAGLVFNLVLRPALGLPINNWAAEEARNILKQALQAMESYWLQSGGRFLAGMPRPTIADLSLACELMQLELLESADRNDLLADCPRVTAWLAAVQDATSPHFAAAHEILMKAARRFQERRDGEKLPDGTPAGRASSLPSRL